MVKRSSSGVQLVTGAPVLIVDDDADAADLFAIWLHGAGHRTFVAKDAMAAMFVAPTLSPSVAVIDIGLPLVDGLELVTMLRELPALAACTYIAVTAYRNADLPVRCRAAGFAAFFEKPMRREALVGAVAEGLMSRQPARSATTVDSASQRNAVAGSHPGQRP